jgi:type II secretory pathway component PulL
MGRRTFFDLTGGKLTVRLLEKNGLSDGVSYDVGPGYSFSLKKQATTPGESILSIPLSLLNFRIIELPFSDTRKIRELLPFEIDGLVLGGTESVVFDAVVLGQTNGQYSILVVCLWKETLRTILEKLKIAGFDPSIVTCLELSHVLASGASGARTADLLISPAPMTDEERTAAALREMERPVLNLRRDEFAYTVDAEKTRNALRMAIALAALIVIVFFADTAITILSLKKENARTRDEIRKTYVGLFPGETKITSEIYQLKAHIKEMREKESSLVGISPLATLLDLAHADRSGISLTEIDQDRETIVLKGECQSLSDVQKFKDSIEGNFGDVVVADTKPSARNRILFTVTAKAKKA